MKTLIYLLLSTIIFAACSNDILSLNEDLSIKLFVEVGSNSNPWSKTMTNIDGGVRFSINDNVGMFIQNKDNPVLWTYDGSLWNPDESVVWENRTDNFEFLAYYPYGGTAQATRSSVPMPDLTVQTGNLDDIGSKDFLVGKCTTSYSANNGIVSFSGVNAFKHVYSLLHVNIVNEQMEQSFVINECIFSGKGIVTPYVYSFDSASEGIKKIGLDEISTLRIDNLSSLSKSAVTVVLNPLTLDTPLTFTLKYTYADKEYESSVNIGNKFAAGSFSKITLKFVDGKLSMTGSEVKDWNVITLDEIVIIGASK